MKMMGKVMKKEFEITFDKNYSFDIVSVNIINPSF
jgi:hypothetical protein